MTALATIPFSSSVYLASEAIVLAGGEAQQRDLLPKLASGALIATFAWAEGAGHPGPRANTARLSGGRLSGS